MTLNNPKAGPGWVSEYQVSGLPFVTASIAATGANQTTRIDFPYITSFVTVKNPGGGGTLRVGFTHSGTLDGNYFTVPASASVNGTWRVKTIYLSGAPFELLAGLTLIDPRFFPTLTGAVGAIPPNGNISGSFGYTPGLG